MTDLSSLELARKFLNKEVEVVIDRQLGTKHPKHGFVYEANYGYIEGVIAPDGEELDAYYLGIDKPIEKARGKVIALIHRTDDNDDKLVVIPLELNNLPDEEILKSVHFQEQWFKSEVLRR
jgi:inorganic pyrophosphatase